MSKVDVLGGGGSLTVRASLAAPGPRYLNAPAIKTNLVMSHGGLVRLLPEWWGLWYRSRHTRPYLAPAWLLPWWQVNLPGDLFVVAARRDGELVGVATYYREAGDDGYRLRPLGGDDALGQGILLDARYRRDVGAAIVEKIALYADLWDHWQIDPATLDGNPSTALAGATDLAADERSPMRRMIDLRRPPTRRSLKPLASGVHIVAAHGGMLDPLLEQLIALHLREGVSGLEDADRIRAFHRLAAPRLEAAGLLRLYGLQLEDRLIGGFYGLAHERRIFHHLSASDREAEGAVDVTVMLAHVAERAAAEGCTQIEVPDGYGPPIQ